MHIVLRVIGWLIVLSIVLSMIFGGINATINTVSENKRKNRELAIRQLAANKVSTTSTTPTTPTTN